MTLAGEVRPLPFPPPPPLKQKTKKPDPWAKQANRDLEPERNRIQALHPTPTFQMGESPLETSLWIKIKLGRLRLGGILKTTAD